MCRGKTLAREHPSRVRYGTEHTLYPTAHSAYTPKRGLSRWPNPGADGQLAEEHALSSYPR